MKGARVPTYPFPPATVQRIVHVEEELPHCEWLAPDRVSFTADAKAAHYQGEREEATELARRLSTLAQYVYWADVEAPPKRLAAPAPSFFPREHNSGLPRHRKDLDARDLRELDRVASYG